MGKIRKHKFWRLLILFNLGLVSLSLVAVYVITEHFIARRKKSTLVYDAHALRRQVLVPNQAYERPGVHFKINALGMRGAPPPVPKRHGAVRIFVMGGSSVFDHLTSESWPERLGELVKARGVDRAESFNAGVPGFSSRETLAYFRDRIRYLEPDIVVFYHGWNDVKYMPSFREGVDVDRFYYVKGWRDAYAWFTSRPPWRNWHALKLIWKRFGKDDRLRENVANGPGTTQVDVDWSSSPGMTFFRANVESFIFEVQRDGALPVLVAQATLAVADLEPVGRKRISYHYVRLGHDDLVEINEAMVRVLAAVAAERNVPFIDPRPFVNGSLEAFSDHVHLTARGSRRLAEVLADDLAKAIVERPGSGVGSSGSTVLWRRSALTENH